MTAAHSAVAGGLTWKTNGGAWARESNRTPGETPSCGAATCYSFNSPSVWAGASDLRLVTQLQVLPNIGDGVALSGPVSDLGAAGSVIKTDFMANGIEPTNLVTYTGSQGGDSGGPWLQTEYGTGNGKAFEQREGRFLYNGAHYCAFMPLNPISAALQASLLIAP